MELSNALYEIGAGAKISFYEARGKPDSAYAYIPWIEEPAYRFYEFDTNFYVARGSRSRTWDVCLISEDAEEALKYFVYEVGKRFQTGTEFHIPPLPNFLHPDFSAYSIPDGRTFLVQGDKGYSPIFSDTIDMPLFHVPYSYIADLSLKELLCELLTPGGGKKLGMSVIEEEKMSDEVWAIARRFI